LLANPGFGTSSPIIWWSSNIPRAGLARCHHRPAQPIPLDPAASVLHYAQEIFEG
jgi:branched-chain amino acid aminotransferase